MDSPLTAKSSYTSVTSSEFSHTFTSPCKFTQTHCLNTTVPINIKGSDIGGRHAPTKTALRHSRMIAMSYTGNKVGSGNFSIIVRYPSLAKYFVCLQVKIAVIIILISTWMFIQIPNLNYRDIPFWSGALLLFSGLLNCSCLCCCRKRVTENYPSWYSCYPKLFTLVISILVAVICVFALLFASIHVYVIKVAECAPLVNQNSSCVCVVTAGEKESIDIIDVGTQTYLYPSLNCHQVTSSLCFALIGSAVANASGTVVSLYFVLLHKTSKFSHKYCHVPTMDTSPIML